MSSFGFPTSDEKNASRLAEWKIRIRRQWSVNFNFAKARVCILHFEPRMIKQNALRPTLQEWAVPTIFPDVPPSVVHRTPVVVRKDPEKRRLNASSRKRRSRTSLEAPAVNNSNATQLAASGENQGQSTLWEPDADVSLDMLYKNNSRYNIWLL